MPRHLEAAAGRHQELSRWRRMKRVLTSAKRSALDRFSATVGSLKVIGQSGG